LIDAGVVRAGAAADQMLGVLVAGASAGDPALPASPALQGIVAAHASVRGAAPSRDGGGADRDGRDSDAHTLSFRGAVLIRILERAGLRSLFDVVTFSDECGVRKPAAAIFLRTLERLGVSAADAIHVGDDPILDVEGPRDVGMGAIQVTPDGRATAPVKPHAVIRHLAELPATVRRLG